MDGGNACTSVFFLPVGYMARGNPDAAAHVFLGCRSVEATKSKALLFAQMEGAKDSDIFTISR